MSPKRLFLMVLASCFVCVGAEDALADATITGSVKLDLPGGKKPRRKKLQMAADPVCNAKHDAPVVSESPAIVDEDGALHNVFVYVKTGLEGKQFDVPSEAAVLDQNGCVYTPHVMGVMAGQDITVLNNDGTLHNVHPKPQNSNEFNKAMPKFMKKIKISFAKPEVMIPVKCDVHPWMQSYVGVLDHPFFAVTGEGGTFELAGLPAGSYTVEAWHESERIGTMTQDVTVADGESKAVDFTFKVKAKK